MAQNNPEITFISEEIYSVKGSIVSSAIIECAVPECGSLGHMFSSATKPGIIKEADAIRRFSKQGWQKSINLSWVCKDHTLIRGKVILDAPTT